jgi:predicted AlkP superfamily phosphohydrolase/phosphomutase
VDGYIGEVRAIAGKNGHVVVVSDHGMEGVGWDFLPNVALRDAGLLVLDEKGGIDLQRSQAFYSPNDGGYVVINRASHGGIVLPKDVPAVKERVIHVLSTLTAPDGRRMVTAVYDAAQADPSLGIGGTEGGDLYLDILSGYLFHPQVQGKAMIRPRHPLASGGHVFNPSRPTMHAIFYAAGPAFKQGEVIPPVRTIDVAPTVSRLLGIPAPADARGRVLNEALK